MYFTCDFETNDYSKFTSTGGGTLAITTENKIQGSYASKMWNNANVRKDLGIEYASLFCGAYFRWTGTPSGYYWYLMLGDGASSNQFTAMVWGGHIKLINGASENISVQSLAANTWYFIEVQQYAEAGHVRFNVLVDGVVWCTLLGDFQGGNSGVRYIKWQGTNDDSVQSYLDNVVASDTQIDYGLKIALAGYSILSQNPQEYAFWSRYASIKIAQIATGQITLSGGSGYAEITHELGITPSFYPIVALSTGKWFPGAIQPLSDSELSSRYVAISSSGGELIDTYSDSTKVRLVVNGADGTVNYAIIIFAEAG